MTPGEASKSGSGEGAPVDVARLFRPEAMAARRRLVPFKPPLVERSLILTDVIYLAVAIGLIVVAAGALVSHRI
jgi:hypothetical protein